jgi:hypothetical protein
MPQKKQNEGVEKTGGVPQPRSEQIRASIIEANERLGRIKSELERLDTERDSLAAAEHHDSAGLQQLRQRRTALTQEQEDLTLRIQQRTEHLSECEKVEAGERLEKIGGNSLPSSPRANP